METDEQGRRVLTTDEARQGVTGHNVRYVLAAGMALALVAMVVLLAIFYSW
jgi:hypothetical protein